MSKSISDDVLKNPASDSNPNERKIGPELFEARATSVPPRRNPNRRSDKPNEPEYEGGEDEHIEDDDDLH